MEPVTRIEGTAVPLDRSDVDTDQIVPAQFLKRIERTGFGPFLFHEWRKDPSFVLNDERYAGATILLAGANFGSGSSREHAPWALEDHGFRAVIAPSFADIFRNNCCKSGCSRSSCRRSRWARWTRSWTTRTRIVVDLETLAVTRPRSRIFAFDDFGAGAFSRASRTSTDDASRDEIAAFEAARPSWLPTAESSLERIAARRLAVSG